jgi:large subunit ribosomal protein L18
MKIPKKRRRENRTDYSKRIKLLRGGTPRLVFRKSNRYLTAQYVESSEARDIVITGMTSKSLKKYGWPEEFRGSLKSTPAAYLLGLSIGKKIIKENLKNPIMDFGMIRGLKKNNAFAFLKGVLDSGVEIKCKEEAFPSEDKIKGKNLKKDFSKIFEEIKSKIENEK